MILIQKYYFNYFFEEYHFSFNNILIDNLFSGNTFYFNNLNLVNNVLPLIQDHHWFEGLILF